MVRAEPGRLVRRRGWHDHWANSTIYVGQLAVDMYGLQGL
jgi:hypothetical protein